MARPIKTGVDYFPHDTDATSKKTIFTLESLFGNDGYAFWFKLLETLGTQEGLFFDCSKAPNWLFLIAKMRVDGDTATKILDTLAQIEAIDPELWERKVVWCQNFADRLSDVYNKRTTETPSKPNFRSENTSFRSENSDIKEVIGEKTPQSKGNKPNKTIGEDRRKSSPTTAGGSADFESFWQAYPKKVSKKTAKAAWKKIKPSAELHRRILGAIDAAKKTEQWAKDGGRFIPYPATWLNQGRWDYEWGTPPPASEYGRPPRQAAAPTFEMKGFKPAEVPAEVMDE